MEYERVPSVSMKRNKKTFVKHDSERFTKFLEDVKQGKKKMSSGALMPHELVGQFMAYGGRANVEPQLDEVTELQWNDYVEKLKQSGLLQSALAVCDVSGSMSGEPMCVAIALSLLTAAVSKPPFNRYKRNWCLSILNRLIQWFYFFSQRHLLVLRHPRAAPNHPADPAGEGRLCPAHGLGNEHECSGTFYYFVRFIRYNC